MNKNNAIKRKFLSKESFQINISMDQDAICQNAKNSKEHIKTSKCETIKHVKMFEMTKASHM